MKPPTAVSALDVAWLRANYALVRLHRGDAVTVAIRRRGLWLFDAIVVHEDVEIHRVNVEYQTPGGGFRETWVLAQDCFDPSALVYLRRAIEHRTRGSVTAASSGGVL
jgi:hypothetical protein